MTLWRRLRYGRPIVVVSGLPRSGTSMMMRMLEAGGMPVVADGVRQPDDSNPHGYFEFEPVKRLHDDPDPHWLMGARGRAIKIVSAQLTWLPETYNYRVIFMQRDLGEVLHSQERMLASAGADDASSDPACLRESYVRHLADVDRLLGRRPAFRVLRVEYESVLQAAVEASRRVAGFISRRLDVEAMSAAVDRGLYRNYRETAR